MVIYFVCKIYSVSKQSYNKTYQLFLFVPHTGCYINDINRKRNKKQKIRSQTLPQMDTMYSNFQKWNAFELSPSVASTEYFPRSSVPHFSHSERGYCRENIFCMEAALQCEVRVIYLDVYHCASRVRFQRPDGRQSSQDHYACTGNGLANK